jgi:hypothetical protein
MNNKSSKHAPNANLRNIEKWEEKHGYEVGTGLNLTNIGQKKKKILSLDYYYDSNYST